jgi:hypothetical protein
MQPDGTYIKRSPAEGETAIRSQARFIEKARERARMSFVNPVSPFRMRPSVSVPSLEPEPTPPLPPARKRRKRDNKTG